MSFEMRKLPKLKHLLYLTCNKLHTHTKPEYHVNKIQFLTTMILFTMIL